MNECIFKYAHMYVCIYMYVCMYVCMMMMYFICSCRNQVYTHTHTQKVTPLIHFCFLAREKVLDRQSRTP
jgi:hypothetical protein